MGSQRPFTRINRPLEALKQQIAAVAPTLSQPELLDLADQIHEIIRTRHGEEFLTRHWDEMHADQGLPVGFTA